MAKTYGKRRAIVNRSPVLGKYHGRNAVVRTLECGHQVNQRSGGEADVATFALCKQCADKKRG